MALLPSLFPSLEAITLVMGVVKVPSGGGAIPQRIRLPNKKLPLSDMGAGTQPLLYANLSLETRQLRERQQELTHILSRQTDEGAMSPE